MARTLSHKPWDECDQTKLEELLESGHTILEVSVALGRTKRSIESRMRQHGFRVKNFLYISQKTGASKKASLWSRKDDYKLMIYAERGYSQEDAGKKLGRTRRAVSSRTKKLGIKWRGGSKSIYQIAQQYGINHITLGRLVDILFWHKLGRLRYGNGSGRRYLLKDDDLDRLHRVIYMKYKLGNLKECKILNAIWGKQVNIIVVKCPECGTQIEHRADRFIVRCVCGMKGYVEGKPPLGAR